MCKRFWILCASLILHSKVSLAATNKILVIENLKSDNPYLSIQIKTQYENAVKLAEETFRLQSKAPKSNVALKVHLDVSENVADALKKSVTGDVIAIVGLAFTGDAGVATKFAEENKISFIAPAASYDELFESNYSKSFGLSMTSVVNGMNHVLSTSGNPKGISVITASDSIYDQLYAKLIKADKNLSGSKFHSFGQFEAPAGKAFNDLDEATILTSYGHVSVDSVLKSSRSNAAVNNHFLATSQWGYAAQFLEKVLKGFKGSISVVTDFFPLYQVSKNIPDDKQKVTSLLRKSIAAAQKFRDRHLKMFKTEPSEFTYAVYDALIFALNVGAGDTVRNSADFHKEMLRDRELAGVSGPTVIKDGKFMPVYYVLEWKQERFQMGEFAFNGTFWKVNR